MDNVARDAVVGHPTDHAQPPGVSNGMAAESLSKQLYGNLEIARFVRLCKGAAGGSEGPFLAV